jgi:UDP-4-amino-4,6-dideoxy-N-acetyl-beta-L-altrosamine N-acetyltransferase
MITFREITKQDAELILTWRTKKRITKYMNTDVEFNIDNQANWIESCYKKKDYYHWIVQYKGVDVGFISLADFDNENKTTSWGFYIGNDEYIGVGAFAPLYLYDFIFYELGVDKICAEVFFDNTKTIKIHMLNGYKFEPDKCRTIYKNNKEVLLVGMSLNKNDFQLKKKSRYKFDFPIRNWEGYASV